MAHVNLDTNKIVGTKEGTLTYYHEIGHTKFEEKSKYGIKIRVLQDITFKSLVFVSSLFIINPLNFLRVALLIIILLNIFSEVFEESWCWLYAKEVKRDDEGIEKSKESQV
jgi:hypothetical protein